MSAFLIQLLISIHLKKAAHYNSQGVGLSHPYGTSRLSSWFQPLSCPNPSYGRHVGNEPFLKTDTYPHSHLHTDTQCKRGIERGRSSIAGSILKSRQLPGLAQVKPEARNSNHVFHMGSWISSHWDVICCCSGALAGS